MTRIFKALAIIVLLPIIGCSTSIESSEENEIKTENSSFTGTIKEINDNSALVSTKVFEGNPESDVFVDLSVNNDKTFQVGDKIKVGFEGIIRESNPAQINTLSVVLVD
ncbi:DUF3221 domain-containing protein [Bacillus sp. CH30_1T]|uniref:DUF3221 domain-containing protein n=1 Tax=Bacillus sp. CH30_1T TaxID=2604836 RepID=UPI0011EDC129|nr:DUF3221 domain-containing protein [Bacillus sp. CH30_1T]KAA0563487.1 DUF3221 domain-containing protein [Bacillus sp. CH30_1T]